MSRITTPPVAQSAGASVQVPPEKGASRVYQKWLRRCCTYGRDVQDWVEAEAELRAEMLRQGTTSIVGTGRR